MLAYLNGKRLVPESLVIWISCKTLLRAYPSRSVARRQQERPLRGFVGSTTDVGSQDCGLSYSFDVTSEAQRCGTGGKSEWIESLRMF